MRDEIKELIVVAAEAVYREREQVIRVDNISLRIIAEYGQVADAKAQEIISVRDSYYAASELLYRLIMDMMRDERVIKMLESAWENKSPLVRV